MASVLSVQAQAPARQQAADAPTYGSCRWVEFWPSLDKCWPCAGCTASCRQEQAGPTTLQIMCGERFLAGNEHAGNICHVLACNDNDTSRRRSFKAVQALRRLVDLKEVICQEACMALRLSAKWVSIVTPRTGPKVRSSLEALCWCTASPVKSSSPQSCWTTWQEPATLRLALDFERAIEGLQK